MSEPKDLERPSARRTPPRDEQGDIVSPVGNRFRHVYGTEEEIAAREGEYLRWAAERREVNGR